MRLKTFLSFTTEAVTAGLAFAFVLLLLFRPEIFEDHPTIEFIEGSIPEQMTQASTATSYADAVEFAAPAVVNIYTQKLVIEKPLNPLLDNPNFRRFFGDRLPTPNQHQETSLGSGVILNSDGFILTNNHVIEGADEISVALRDGRTSIAQLVGRDPESDLAVLKIDLPELPSITFGQSETLRIGDIVLAIGNPFGVGQTVTSGIVSATGRNHLGLSTFENFIQTDAAINPGNSGGALINVYGQLVGINTAIFSGSGGSQGIGFAIPVSLAKGVLTQIIMHGRALRGWLGVKVQDLNPGLAESFQLEGVSGALIAGVQPLGPADQANLKPGDIISHVNKQAIQGGRDLMNNIAYNAPGSVLVLNILRNGEHLEIEATLGERPSPKTQRR